MLSVYVCMLGGSVCHVVDVRVLRMGSPMLTNVLMHSTGNDSGWDDLCGAIPCPMRVEHVHSNTLNL